MSQPKLVVCHFTVEELEYIAACMQREQDMTRYLSDNLKGLHNVGVNVHYLQQPGTSFVGKLHSYIKKGQAE